MLRLIVLRLIVPRLIVPRLWLITLGRLSCRGLYRLIVPVADLRLRPPRVFGKMLLGSEPAVVPFDHTAASSVALVDPKPRLNVAYSPVHPAGPCRSQVSNGWRYIEN